VLNDTFSEWDYTDMPEMISICAESFFSNINSHQGANVYEE